MNVVDMVGRRYGKLVVVSRSGSSKLGHAMWECQCDCGSFKVVDGSNLRVGLVKSCGCMQYDFMRGGLFKTHGMSGTSTYRTWASMRQRCNNENDDKYSRYGGRGIKVCDRWNDFENFYVDMGERPKGMTIDRLDNTKGYFLSNCRWAACRIQQNNRRNNRIILFNGKSQTIAQWSRDTGIPYSVIYSRLTRLGWTIEKSITTPVIEL